jgi:hypothetical protein
VQDCSKEGKSSVIGVWFTFVATKEGDGSTKAYLPTRRTVLAPAFAHLSTSLLFATNFTEGFCPQVHGASRQIQHLLLLLV